MDLSKFTSTEGYKKNSPDRHRPFNVIPSGRITMQDVEGPVLGKDELGNEKMMYPGGEYQFPGSQVTEIPMFQTGEEYEDMELDKDQIGKLKKDGYILEYQDGGEHRDSLYDLDSDYSRFLRPTVNELGEMECDPVKGCSQFSSRKLGELYGDEYNYDSGAENAWFKKAKVIDQGGKMIWDSSQGDINDSSSNFQVGDFVSLNRTGSSPGGSENNSKTVNAPNYRNSEDLNDPLSVEHSGIIVGFNNEGYPIIEHSGQGHGSATRSVLDGSMVNLGGSMYSYNAMEVFRHPQMVDPQAFVEKSLEKETRAKYWNEDNPLDFESKSNETKDFDDIYREVRGELGVKLDLNADSLDRIYRTSIGIGLQETNLDNEKTADGVGDFLGEIKYAIKDSSTPAVHAIKDNDGVTEKEALDNKKYNKDNGLIAPIHSSLMNKKAILLKDKYPNLTTKEILDQYVKPKYGKSEKSYEASDTPSVGAFQSKYRANSARELGLTSGKENRSYSHGDEDSYYANRKNQLINVIASIKDLEENLRRERPELSEEEIQDYAIVSYNAPGKTKKENQEIMDFFYHGKGNPDHENQNLTYLENVKNYSSEYYDVAKKQTEEDKKEIEALLSEETIKEVEEVEKKEAPIIFEPIVNKGVLDKYVEGYNTSAASTTGVTQENFISGFQSGGEYEDLELGDEEIAKLRSGGYVVEEYQDGGGYQAASTAFFDRAKNTELSDITGKVIGPWDQLTEEQIQEKLRGQEQIQLDNVTIDGNYPYKHELSDEQLKMFNADNAIGRGIRRAARVGFDDSLSDELKEVPMNSAMEGLKTVGQILSVPQALAVEAYADYNDPYETQHNYRSALPDFAKTSREERYSPQRTPSDLMSITDSGTKKFVADMVLDPSNLVGANLIGKSVGLAGKTAKVLDKTKKFGDAAFTKAMNNPNFFEGYNRLISSKMKMGDKLEKVSKESVALAKGARDNFIDEVINPIAYKKEIQEMNLLNNSISSKYKTPEMTERLSNIGIAGDMIDKNLPKLSFNRGRGSAYVSNNINLDLKQLKELKKKGYELPLNSIYEHELGHWFQDIGTVKSDAYLKDLLKHQNNPASVLPPRVGKLYQNKIDDALISNIQTKLELSPVGQSNLDYFMTGNTTDAERLAGSKGSQEPYAFLREMRQNMINKGYLKSTESKTTDELIEKFMKENPKDRISSFTKDTKNNAAGLSSLMNMAPAALAGVAGTAALNSVNYNTEQPEFKSGGEYEELELDEKTIDRLKAEGYTIM